MSTASLTDPENQLGRLILIPAKNITSTGAETGVDLRDFEGRLLLHLNHANASAGTIAIKIEESDASASGYADMDPAKAFTTITTSNGGQQVLSIDTRATKRYIRAHATSASSGDAICSLVAIGVKKYN